MLKKGLIVAIVAGAAAAFASVALGANIICLAGSDSCTGTGSADTITGSNDDDNIFALGGSDSIFPQSGVDTTKAGPGNDMVTNDLGVDKILGAGGSDFIDETADLTAANVINGGPGRDCMGGSRGGGDTIRGSGGNENGNVGKCTARYGIFGFEGNDRLLGGAGSDGILGGGGADLMAGGKGKDYLDAKSDDGSGSDTLRCGPGRDRYSASGNDVVANSCERKVPAPPAPLAARW